MSIKTISLELDAYEKLRKAKRGKESFSQVVRRAHFDPPDHSGAAIIKELSAVYGRNQGMTGEELDHLEQLDQENHRQPALDPSPWEDEERDEELNT